MHNHQKTSCVNKSIELGAWSAKTAELVNHDFPPQGPFLDSIIRKQVIFETLSCEAGFFIRLILYAHLLERQNP